MTDLVIMMGDMSMHPIQQIIKRWATRQEMAVDAGVDLFAVHRWFQRRNIPGKYDARLIAGASRRGIALTAQDLVDARSSHTDQAGHGNHTAQDGVRKNTAGAS